MDDRRLLSETREQADLRVRQRNSPVLQGVRLNWKGEQMSRPTTALGVLIAARAKIEDPKNWTKGTPARDSHGRKTLATNPDACMFCMIGALDSAIGSLGSESAFMDAADALLPFIPNGWGIPDYNDHESTDHADVLAIFDKAIASRQVPA